MVGDYSAMTTEGITLQIRRHVVDTPQLLASRHGNAVEINKTRYGKLKEKNELKNAPKENKKTMEISKEKNMRNPRSNGRIL